MTMEQMVSALQKQLATLQEQLNEQEPHAPRKIDKKIQVIADPGSYEGEKAKFQEWWTKIQVWVKANWSAFDSDFELASAIWSRMKGPTAGRYAETRMSECLNSSIWPTWDLLKREIENLFQPATELDWAKNTISKFKQGSMRIEDYTTKWASLARQAHISDEHGIFLLEANTAPEIIKTLYTNGLRKSTTQETLAEIRRIGQAQEMYQLHHAGRTPFYPKRPAFTPSSGAKTYAGRGEPMDIGATSRGCYNCGENHMVRDCPKAKDKCQSCGYVNNRHKWGCKAPRKEVRSTEAIKSPTDSMEEEARQAYYFDLYETKMKAQGKVWSS